MIARTFWLSSLVVVAFAAPAAARPRPAITAGSEDAGDPAVVGLANCSGTVIAPRVVLTAAHCVDGLEPSLLTVSFGPHVDGATIDVRAIDARVSPDWDPIGYANDIAVVMLDDDAPVPPVPLSTQPIDDSFLGAPVRLVGFGYVDATQPSTFGDKRQGSAALTAYSATTLDVSGGPSYACFGDSGGPALMTISGVEYLAGVTSRGDKACRAFDVETRVDPFVAAFIGPYVDASMPGSVATGGRCAYADQCSSGTCRPAADDRRLMFCSQECRRDRDCPAPLECSAGWCMHRTPSPGAVGAPCDRDGDCAGRLCVASQRGGARFCSVACTPTAAEACGPGYGCMSTRDEPGGSYCLPTSAGCSLAARPDGDTSWLFIVVAIVGAKRRRLSAPLWRAQPPAPAAAASTSSGRSVPGRA